MGQCHSGAAVRGRTTAAQVPERHA
ncbi:hypothetical protein STPYR_12607 [uncultured Stenotrophomonas sp.]|uniref:Uncharacterized protein n=1 Tax=uncultured Stenotrophomonas sp. TaxID=165438 RepID=A0A1Y5QBY2_9GAMM|nr:hypothetical protein STPYR_12607 [uncultured Stenotrophomonas sp.]